MELRRDLLLGVGSLFLLNLLVALVTIALFTRMGPVIDQIMRENVHSTEAGERMLAALATAGDGPMEPAERKRYVEALGAARSNVTEEAEKAPLDRLMALEPAVVAGAASARAEAVTQIDRLTAINYQAIAATALEARRLGLAGAWFSVFVAGFALILSVLAVRRLNQRLLVPVRELWATLEAARAGNTFRRCAGSHLPEEIWRIFTQVNEMLDQRSNPRPYTDRRAHVDRAVVLWALRQRQQPTFVIDDRGQIFAANGPAHALLGDLRGPEVRAALAQGRSLERGAKLAGGFELVAEPVPEGEVWVCEVRGAA
jgi:hypothetical protein